MASLSPLLRHLRPLATRTLIITAGLIFVNDHVLELTTVTGASMAPSLSPAQHATGACDTVLWRKDAFAPRDLRRGDVVHFMNPARPEALAVKRVVALEGDGVVLDQRRRVGDGTDGRGAVRAWNEPGRRKGARGRGADGEVVVVPPGHVWVEGDNWRQSHDSNYYGPLSMSLITGRAVAIVWPPGRWGSGAWEGFEIQTKVVPAEERIRREEEGMQGLMAQLADTVRPPPPS